MVSERRLSLSKTISNDLEKRISINQIEYAEHDLKAVHNSPEDEEFLAMFDEKKKKKMYRKIDVRLLPMLGLLYLFACEWEGRRLVENTEKSNQRY